MIDKMEVRAISGQEIRHDAADLGLVHVVRVETVGLSPINPQISQAAMLTRSSEHRALCKAKQWDWYHWIGG